MQLMTTRGNVLVVDDDEQIREYLQLRLQDEGFACTAVANGIEAIENLSTSATPDVILLDLNMPGMDGMEFLRLAREHVGKEFGVIVMTGASGPRLKEQVVRYGALTMIQKPVDFEKLLRLIRIQQEFAKTRANLSL